MSLHPAGNLDQKDYSASMVQRDDNAPATQGQLSSTEKVLRNEITEMGSQLRQEMSDLRVELRQEMSDLKEYMSVFGENLAADFRAASKDQVEVLKDTLLLHDRRITRLEDRAVAA